MGHDWSPKSVKLKGFDRGERGLLIRVHRHCLVQHSAETLKLETSFSQAPCCTVPETVVDTCAMFDGIIAA